MKAKMVLFVVFAAVAALVLRLAFESDTVVPVHTPSPESVTLADPEASDQPVDSSQADQAPSDTQGPMSALDQKLRQRDANAEMALGMSRAEIEELVADASDAFFSGPDSLRERLTEIHTQLAETYGVEEADFRLALITNSSDWDAVKSLVANRESILGTNGHYNQALLNIGITNGEVSFEEIEKLTSTGSILPENSIYLLAKNGRIDLIAELSENNLLTNPNYEQPVLGANALGALISHASYRPEHYGSTEMIGDAVDTLINAGVVPMPTHGGLGPMDHALMGVSNRNFEVRYTIVRKLLEHGVPVEQSHRELVASMPDSGNKEKLQQLLKEQM